MITINPYVCTCSHCWLQLQAQGETSDGEIGKRDGIRRKPVMVKFRRKMGSEGHCEEKWDQKETSDGEIGKKDGIRRKPVMVKLGRKMGSEGKQSW
ncbi:hypothetical protein RRG08_025778 [Elysia crispata]|uniref:Uncharacterized protein n=1 Tax=Elysia crispata TaxID=231223 RepID=A0AAE1CRM5_9GAST|nr:hypothetical protein RRG08_025778 [Elysia crispata]